MGKNKKEPTARFDPKVQKRPRIGVNPSSPDQVRPVWRLHLMDLDGPWSWKKIDAPKLLALQQRLASFETMNWTEVENQSSCGYIPVSVLCKEARERLSEIGQDDVDHLYKLRISQKERLWGIRDQMIFRILWWDPDHSVYPMNIANN